MNNRALPITFAVLVVLTLSLGFMQLTPLAANDASSYFVDGINGSDTNSGAAPEQAWKTIQKAANTVSAGATVIVLPGSYPERVKVARPGSQGAPITFIARGAVTTRGFTVVADYITIQGFEVANTPDDYSDGYGIFVDASGCVIQDNFINSATRGGIDIFARPGDEENTTNCVVRNNRIYRSAMVGIELYGRKNLVENNEIWDTIQYHPRWVNPPGYADADGIRFFGSGHIVRGNYIHDIRFGIPENVNPHIDCFQTWSDAAHEAASYIVFEQNRCENVQAQTQDETGQAFMMQNASNLIIRNNILHAFRIVNSVNNSNLTIVNNILANDLNVPLNYYPQGISLRNSLNSVVKNNIFYNQPSHNLYVADADSGSTLDAGNNLVYRSDGGRLTGSASSDDLWNVDPMFVDPAAGDYHLQDASPAIDRGIDLNDVTDDFSGSTRPQGYRPDIGVFEASEKPVPTVIPIPPAPTMAPPPTLPPTLEPTPIPDPHIPPEVIPGPKIDKISPGRIVGAAAAQVTLKGSGFQPGAEILFGANSCSSVEFVSSKSLVCTLQLNTPQTVDVTVTNPDGQSDTLAAAFTYKEASRILLPLVSYHP